MDTTKLRFKLEVPWDAFKGMPVRELVTTRPGEGNTLGSLSRSVSQLMGATFTGQPICITYHPFTYATFPVVVDVKDALSEAPAYSIHIYEPTGQREIGTMSLRCARDIENPFFEFTDGVLRQYVEATKSHAQRGKDKQWWQMMDL